MTMKNKNNRYQSKPLFTLFTSFIFSAIVIRCFFIIEIYEKQTRNSIAHFLPKASYDDTDVFQASPEAQKRFEAVRVIKDKADEGNHALNSVVHELPDIYVDEDAIKEVQADKHERFHLYLIGERHSGTNWIADQLKGCFPDMKPSTQFTRYKHWFQDEQLKRKSTDSPAIVVAMFRNVYDWVHVMHTAPHHAPAHLYMDVDKFLEKPWAMDRPRRDKAVKNQKDSQCMQMFGYNDIVPCIKGIEPPRDKRTKWDYFSGWDPIYELKRDGSGQPYESIVEMRADKIRNFMNISSYENVHVSMYILIVYI